jgi:hypothetical protein
MCVYRCEALRSHLALRCLRFRPAGVTAAKKAKQWLCLACEPSPFLAALTRNTTVTSQWMQADFPPIPVTRQRNALSRQATNPIPIYTVPPFACTRGLGAAPYQHMWACGTCKFGRHSLFCEACAARCHAGHELLPKGPQLAPCVCSETTGR